MNNILNDVSFHDEKIIDIKKEGNDVILTAMDDQKDMYVINVKNAKIVSDTEVNLDDIKDSIIISLSYNKFEEKEDYIHLETVSKVPYFNDELYLYSDNIIISKNNNTVR